MCAASGARWRAEVVAFADAMEAQLRANDYKRHWLNLGMQTLSMRLTQEREELRVAVAAGNAGEILREAANVANFAMMIADKARALSPAPSACTAPAKECATGCVRAAGVDSSRATERKGGA